VRTTVTIDDKLFELVMDRAREEGRTLGEYVEAALRQRVAQPRSIGDPPIPVFRGDKGFAPGIDPSSNASLLDAADEAEGFYG
jgi:hypothetical protein